MTVENVMVDNGLVSYLAVCCTSVLTVELNKQIRAIEDILDR